MTKSNSIKPLQGKIAVIVGATRRAGRQVALDLANDGANIVITAKSSGTEINSLEEEIRSYGVQALPLLFDVADESEVVMAFAKIKKQFGHVDILINNAAIRRQSPFLEMSLDEWQNIMSVNLDGVFLCCREGLKIMNDGGTVINLGGVSAHIGVSNRAHVASAKAGIIGLTKSLAIEFAERGVTVNCVAPGKIGGARAKTAGVSPISSDRIPLGREGVIEEVAAAIRFLCLPEARFMTGQTLHVSGGLFMP